MSLPGAKVVVRRVAKSLIPARMDFDVPNQAAQAIPLMMLLKHTESSRLHVVKIAVLYRYVVDRGRDVKPQIRPTRLLAIALIHLAMPASTSFSRLLVPELPRLDGRRAAQTV